MAQAAVDRIQAPRVQLLSNGRYHVMVTGEGAGYSGCGGMALTRWSEDATGSGLGSFCYVRDVSRGRVWSAAAVPVGRATDAVEAVFSPGRACLLRRHAEDGIDIETRTDIAVAPDDDLEIRRIHLRNHAATRSQLSLTSYSEVVLQGAAVDAAHPAFEKLFVETEILPGLQAILCTRRPRDAKEPTPWMFHLLLPLTAPVTLVSFETDRMRFIGRGRSTARPLALDTDAALSGTAGAVLDPVAAIRFEVTVPAGEAVAVHLVSGLAWTREACLELVRKCREPGFAEQTLAAASVRAQADLAALNMSDAESALSTEFASSILYANAALRASPEVLASNHQGQSGLWGLSISGDLPVVLLEVDEPAHLDLVQQMLRIQAHWRLHGLVVDLVILAAGPAAQQMPLMAGVLAAIAASSAAARICQPGGAYVREASTVPRAEHVLLQAAARVIIKGGAGPLAGQLARGRETPGLVHQKPAGLDTWPANEAPSAAGVSSAPHELVLANDLGGFTPDGREYVITVSAGRMTPVPWVNVLANPSFGTLVSESGSASTWSENAQQFRLTPWSNDPVADGNTEAFYIRDEDSGRYWSPTLLPTPSDDGHASPYVARHGFGYSVFQHSEDGIDAQMTVFVAQAEPLKYVLLSLHNASARSRRLSVTGYVEWVLGDERPKTAMHVGTALDAETGALLARNAYNTDFAGRTAFFAGDLEGEAPDDASVCADRRSFLGHHGNLQRPAAMSQPQLGGAVGHALDPCAALRVPLALAAGETREIVFRLGAGVTLADARQLLRASRGPAAAHEALAGVKAYWAHTLGAVHVKTPDPALDVLANGWLVYQTLACRLWARTAFYQASGAFGFRDQLQDVMALLHADPALAREHLLRSASRQYAEGDVQHWWHPGSGRGLRTRCSDDLLWLPWAACRYVQVTGDAAVFDEPLPFLRGRTLPEGEVSAYEQPELSGESASLFEHCRRAIEHSLRTGPHGLPLMGSGDWNDGMNLVGAAGQGESVWLGFFLHAVLARFGGAAQHRGEHSLAVRYRDAAVRLRTAVDDRGWDGAWYRRGWFDDGSPLGAAANVECRIDSIAQSWSVLSGAGDTARRVQAMDALDRLLVDRDAGLVRLIDPPFDRSDPSPGYIQGYVRGVRENGGQYTHAAVWAAMAFAQLGDGRRAWELFDMLNPIRHGLSASAISVYKAEPYVVAGDVYSLPPHTGRGGWTWYTGAAGWLYRLILESLLGLNVEGERLRLTPCMPADWDSFELSYRHRRTLYKVQVLRSPASAWPELKVDGVEVVGRDIALVDDGREHTVVLRLAGNDVDADGPAA